MIVKKVEQQIGLPTASDAGNNLDKSIVLLANQLIQVLVSFILSCESISNQKKKKT